VGDLIQTAQTRRDLSERSPVEVVFYNVFSGNKSLQPLRLTQFGDRVNEFITKPWGRDQMVLWKNGTPLQNRAR